MSIPPVPQRYVVAVRELCAFAAKAGDLDHRFMPSPTAQEGVDGHRTVATRRGAARRNEVVVAGDYKQLSVRGRADGLDESRGLLEEVKTHRGDLQRMPANHRALHWAQAKVYGALLCRQLGLARLNVALVYFDIDSQEETILVEPLSAAALEAFFAALCESFLAWAAQELAHRARRDAGLRTLTFPHDDFRAGQRQLAQNVFLAARLGRDLMAEAPTGIGKTMATLYPMLKACATEGLDKVFYLTAKGSGQQLALDAVASLRAGQPGMSLRVLELVSRDRSCEHPGKSCHGDSCPLARGFYDRLPAARAEAVGAGRLSRDVLRELARRHAVCPYYLTQELVRWSDLVIGDYNYLFDATASLHALTLANQWRTAVLVDEAHNLLERARSMYSCSLQQGRFDAARQGAPVALRPSLRRLQRAWSGIARSQTGPYVVHASIPTDYAAALRDVTAAMSTCLADTPDEVGRPLLDFYFDALNFGRLADSFGAHSLFDCSTAAPGPRGAPRVDLCIRNVVPAPFLRPRYAATRATVLFSATLSPRRFYADLLGLADDAACLTVESPFTTSQLDVRIVSSISTRWADRAASLAPIAAVIARQSRRVPGNYLAFFSSFDYLEQVAATLQRDHRDVACWVQSRDSDERTRSAFLARFTVDGAGVGFAVLGGAFAEGIDLPGRRLIGAFIATLGLPQRNAVNEQLRRRLQQTHGAGYDYAYLFPGLRKVVQAAGRVIRTTSDRGSVHLIDDRFGDARVRSLLPAWWAQRQ